MLKKHMMKIMEINNWGVNLIPIVGWLISIGKYTKYPGGIRYHVYRGGRHERWSKHERTNDDLQRCSKCSLFSAVYYELESWE